MFAPWTLTLLVAARLSAASWDPGAGREQIPLWPNGVPDAVAAPYPPEDVSVDVNPKRWSGRAVTSVSNVTAPTLSYYPPRGKPNGAALIVFPGGGYQILAIDLEGSEVCDWITPKGVACFVLKYRVPNSGCSWDKKLKKHVVPKVFTALQDAQRAVGLVRHNALKWSLDPHKIGVIGFSAGGNLAAAISTNYESRIYPAVDEADQESCRPDFAMPLYPGHMSVNHGNLSRLNPALPVTRDTPPTFLVHAVDDPVDPVEYTTLYYAALKKAGARVEMHLFEKGGHAFALRRNDDPVTRWPDLAEGWLVSIGILPRE